MIGQNLDRGVMVQRSLPNLPVITYLKRFRKPYEKNCRAEEEDRGGKKEGWKREEERRMTSNTSP